MAHLTSSLINLAGALAIAIGPVSAQTTFTHEARIPADADVSSIRFESVKQVKIATAIRTTADARYCAEAASREGESMFCGAGYRGSVQPVAFVRAYEVTYSFDAAPMASDEFGGRHFTFSVFLRPEELSAGERARLSRSAGEEFEIAVSHPSATYHVADAASSNLCPGDFVDGNWIPANSGCTDHLVFRTVTAPADYVIVTVEPAARVLADLTR